VDPVGVLETPQQREVQFQVELGLAEFALGVGDAQGRVNRVRKVADQDRCAEPRGGQFRNLGNVVEDPFAFSQQFGPRQRLELVVDARGDLPQGAADEQQVRSEGLQFGRIAEQLLHVLAVRRDEIADADAEPDGPGAQAGRQRVHRVRPGVGDADDPGQGEPFGCAVDDGDVRGRERQRVEGGHDLPQLVHGGRLAADVPECPDHDAMEIKAKSIRCLIVPPPCRQA
jgi:hypothetical protein